MYYPKLRDIVASLAVFQLISLASSAMAQTSFSPHATNQSSTISFLNQVMEDQSVLVSNDTKEKIAQINSAKNQEEMLRKIAMIKNLLSKDEIKMSLSHNKILAELQFYSDYHFRASERNKAANLSNFNKYLMRLKSRIVLD